LLSFLTVTFMKTRLREGDFVMRRTLVLAVAGVLVGTSALSAQAVDSVAKMPEFAVVMLVGCGLVGLAGYVRKRSS